MFAEFTPKRTSKSLFTV